MITRDWCRAAGVGLVLVLAGAAIAQPSSVEHTFNAQTFGEVSGVTQREPDVPREGEMVDLYLRVSFQFSYDRVAIYYTTDGTEPSGSFGTGSGTTQVLRNDLGSISFLRNENSGGTRDWWKATLPAGSRNFNQTVKYKISAWKPFVGGEVFANGGNSYTFANKIAWPGAGAGQPSPSAGYPPVSFWKEEAMFGNGYVAGMIDQNGTLYDIMFPTTGGVQGVGTRNEGYVGGNDTFPPNLPSGWRGQMHVNQAMVGIRPVSTGVTHWLSNPVGSNSFTNVAQAYNPTSNTVITSQTLSASGNNIALQQFDFAPIGITFPNDNGGNAQRHIYVKRLTLTNNTGSAQDVNLYYYVDPALNGGDNYDAMFVDSTRKAMVAFDNTFRNVTGTGIGFSSPNEYNPTTFPGFDKNISLYLASAMKQVNAGGTLVQTATDFWRDTSADNGQGWMAMRVNLPVGTPVTVDLMMVGVDDRFAGASATYNFKAANVVDWFYANNMGTVLSATDAYWANWLNSGTTIDFPDDRYDTLMRRGLLATALHQSTETGAIVAGYHNGAYLYAWPRDAMWAAVTLLRAGHIAEAENAMRWMRDVCYRDVEPGFGNNPITGQPYKGFWKQKYSTDGYTVWGAPQIDGTAVYPWALWWHYKMQGNDSYLNSHYAAIWDAVKAMTTDSSDSRLRYEEAFNLVYSNNLWEDSYDTFIFSNANVIRGLRDASNIANRLGRPGDASYFNSLADTIQGGLNARLDWNGENTDASQLGIVYPFETHVPIDSRATKVVDRINGVATDRFGNNHPLIRFGGFPNDQYGWTDLVDRYWGDGYWGGGQPWGGGPWYLTTMWYGCYYAMRQDYIAGKGDIDNHKYRLDLLVDRLGPVGFGAEQVAPKFVNAGLPGSLLYPGQNDFVLQTAWPNAWESMSFFVDSLFMFLGYEPNAGTNTIKVRPKLPTAWPTITYKNLELGSKSVDLTISENAATKRYSQKLTNNSGGAITFNTVIRVPSTETVVGVYRNGVPTAYTYSGAGAFQVFITNAIETGAGDATTYTVVTGCPCDLNGDTVVEDSDFVIFANAYNLLDCTDPSMPANCPADFNGDGFVDDADFVIFADAYNALLCP